MSRGRNDNSTVLGPTALGRRLGSGKEADVFELGEAAVKLFNEAVPKHTVFREAAALAQAEALGLPVPAVMDVRRIDGRWAMAMSRAAGPSFADALVARPAEKTAHLKAMALLHIRIHACEAIFLGTLKARLEANIRRATALSDGRQRKLLAELASLPDGDRLCHGDFHPWNILGPLARPSVIDWIAASRGSPAADVCRSYVLIKPTSPEMATAYVDTYAQISGESLEQIFRWLPVVAAARLAEGVPVEADGLLAMLDAQP
jgi:aminoglycoside phosphotransferase (APT) family kinase protein